MQNKTDTRLHGDMLFAARLVWVTLVSLTLGVFGLGILPTLKIARALRPETIAGLAHLGISADFPAIYTVALDTGTMIVFAAITILIFYHRSDDWMVMFVGLMLLLTALLYTAPAFEAKVPMPLLTFLVALAEISQVAFVYLFPDGRFVPRWTAFLLIPLLVWRPIMWGMVYLPTFHSLQRSGENFFYIPQQSWDLELFLGLLALGIIAQIYRYRHHSTPVQRQQTKWLVMGMIVAVLIIGSEILAINTVGVLQQLGSQALIARLLSRTIRQLALIQLPLVLAFSILRYRLWDIDHLINRTLVYGTLTGMLVLIYAGSIIILQLVVRSLTGGTQVTIIVSTLIIATLFQPLRKRTQQVIDRHFYRSKYDAAQKIAEFSTAVRRQLQLGQLTQQLIEEVEETMQPASISLWLREREQNQTKHKRYPSQKLRK